MKNLEEREIEFREACFANLKFEDEGLRMEFTDYWTEHSPGAKKARWEKEKVFDIKKRFATWKRNAEKWNKTIVMKPSFVDKVLDKQKDLNALREQLKQDYGDSKAS